MIRTRAFTAEGPGSIPGWGTKIPQAMQYGQKKKKIFLKIKTNSIVEKYHTKLTYVAKPGTRAHTSLGIRIYIFEKKHTSIWQS